MSNGVSDYFLDEYLDAAYEQGYEAFFQGQSHPYDPMPTKEKEYWHLGWKKAQMEALNNGDD